jgi:hypothetical protein
MIKQETKTKRKKHHENQNRGHTSGGGSQSFIEYQHARGGQSRPDAAGQIGL